MKQTDYCKASCKADTGEGIIDGYSTFDRQNLYVRQAVQRWRIRAFTLIELLVAITIFAVIAVLSWRGLEQIIRGREIVTSSMEDARVFAQLFDQIRIDARLAASENEIMEAVVSVSDNALQIIRSFSSARTSAPRLQVVRYRITGGRVIRYASPSLDSIGALRRASRDIENDDWSAVPLMRGVSSLSAWIYFSKIGWTMQIKNARAIIHENEDTLKVLPHSNIPLQRLITGLKVSISATSLQKPIIRVFLIGE